VFDFTRLVATAAVFFSSDLWAQILLCCQHQFTCDFTCIDLQYNSCSDTSPGSSMDTSPVPPDAVNVAAGKGLLLVGFVTV